VKKRSITVTFLESPKGGLLRPGGQKRWAPALKRVANFSGLREGCRDEEVQFLNNGKRRRLPPSVSFRAPGKKVCPGGDRQTEQGD